MLTQEPQPKSTPAGFRLQARTRSLALRAAACILGAAFIAAPPAGAQSKVSVESNPQLFSVLCALYAAGYDFDSGAVTTHPVQVTVRNELAKVNGPATDALRAYYREHRAGDPTATLSRYVSFALVVNPAPRYEFTMPRPDLPPDALLLEGFNEILAAFVKEANIEQLWTKIQPAYRREIDRLQSPVGDIVLNATGYLREVQRPFRDRTFTVYVEPLVGGRINFRSISDHYSIVLSGGDQPPLDDIRHAFLHFMIDPLVYRYPGVVESRRPLHRFISRAARVAPEFREEGHFPELVAECLVRAVELRLTRQPADRIAAALAQADTDGYILVRAFYNGLVEGFDKSEPAMGFYFPDLVRLIDVRAESARLEKVQFSAAMPVPVASERPQESELDRWLREGENQVAIPDAASAVATFEKIQAKYPGQPRALYGLAVAKLLVRDLEASKEVFRQIIGGQGIAEGLSADPRILAMSHVYLGRIFDVEGNRELALTEYRAAMNVTGAPEMALRAARRGIDQKFEPASTNKEPVPQRP